LKDVTLYTSTVKFNEPEQNAFLALYEHFDANPRRIKRQVNIYRLVRQLIRSHEEASQAAPGDAQASLLDNPRHLMAWLALCEQWPYTAHMLLEVIDNTLKQSASDLQQLANILAMPLPLVYSTKFADYVLERGDPALLRLDLKHERLKSLIETQLADFTVKKLLRLRRFTVNFNPALSAEIQLTLAKGEKT
jgi:hypothetical protein